MLGINIKHDTRKAEQKLGSTARDRGQYAMGNQMLSDMTMYVPLKDGPLRQSGHMTEDHETLVWETPYARVQYYVQHTNYTTPGTGSRWDLAAKGNHVKDWKKAWLKGAGF